MLISLGSQFFRLCLVHRGRIRAASKSTQLQAVMEARRMVELRLVNLQVNFLDDTIGVARSEGVHAAWHCKCDDPSPLIGRCLQPDQFPATVCPSCGRTFEVLPGDNLRPYLVQEVFRERVL